MNAASARAQRSATNTGKVLGGRVAAPLAQVGVVHLVLDDAECDPRVAADDDHFTDRIAGDSRGAGAPAGRLGLHQGQSADSRDDRRRPAGRLDVAKLILGRDSPGADQLDPVPRHPVRRFAPQSLDPEALGQAGGAVDRPGRAQIRKLVGPPRLGRNPSLDTAHPAVRRTAGSSSGWGHVPGARASHWTTSVGCMPVARQTSSRSSLGIVDRVENHQAVSGRRLGHDGCKLRKTMLAKSIQQSSTAAPRTIRSSFRFPLVLAAALSASGTTCRPGPRSRARRLRPSSRIEAVSRVKRSGAV